MILVDSASVPPLIPWDLGISASEAENIVSYIYTEGEEREGKKLEKESYLL